MKKLFLNTEGILQGQEAQFFYPSIMRIMCKIVTVTDYNNYCADSADPPVDDVWFLIDTYCNYIVIIINSFRISW